MASGMKYDKLVRDRIPEMIGSRGETAIMRVADDTEYFEKLKEKLGEETREFLESESPEELADVLEVLHAIRDFKGVTAEEIELIRKKKAEERGGFSERIILEETLPAKALQSSALLPGKKQEKDKPL